MVELKLFLMPPLKRSGRVKAFLENTTRRVEIFQKSRLGLDSSLEGRFHIFASKTVRFDRLRLTSYLLAVNYPHFLRLIVRKLLYLLKIHRICIYTRHRTGPILLGIKSR